MSSCTTINAHITDQVLQLSNLPRIASGLVGALQVRCDFCGKWDGCGKAAVFYREGGDVYHVPIVDGLVTVPHEVLAEEGFFYFGIMGQDDITRTTEVIRVEVAKGALTVATATPEDPTPDIYAQLLAAYGEVMQTREELVAGGYIETLKEQNTGGKFSVWVGTQAEYESITIKDANCLYILKDDPETGGDIQVDLDLLEAELKDYADSGDAFLAGSLRTEMDSVEEALGSRIDATAASVAAVRADLPIHAKGGTDATGGKFTYDGDIFVCAKNGDDTTGKGTSAKPYKTIDRALSEYNKNRQDNRIYIKTAGTYDCSYYFFNHMALHLTGSVSGVIVNFTNENTITFYGGHYNFKNITLKHSSCFNFETVSLAVDDVHFDTNLLKLYGSFITTMSSAPLKCGAFEFYGTNGRIQNITATRNVTNPISVTRGCNLQFGYTSGNENAGTVTVSTSANSSEGACYMKVEHSVVYLRVATWGGETRAIGIDGTSSLVFMDKSSHTYLAAKTAQAHSANGCVFVNNSSATSPKNLFTAGAY